jgi:lipoprotein-anchoring transpeptidase ErfK/SrfK
MAATLVMGVTNVDARERPWLTLDELAAQQPIVDPPPALPKVFTTPAEPPVMSAVPTTTLPTSPPESVVATVRPEIDAIWPTTEPGGGEYVELEYPVTNPTYFGNPLTLMVTDRTPDGEWIKVQIPIRPNGTEGWIPATDVDLSSHFVRIEVVLSERSVRVWDGETLIAETSAVIGADVTPTPLGTFFVNDLVERFEGSSYGPYILSLSAFSEALETYGGGVPVIAIHGTNRPELIGGAHSAGCIRIENDMIRFLAEVVPMGTPVTISA